MWDDYEKDRIVLHPNSIPDFNSMYTDDQDRVKSKYDNLEELIEIRCTLKYCNFLEAMACCPTFGYGLGPPLYNNMNFCLCSKLMKGFHDLFNLNVPVCSCNGNMEPHQLIKHFEGM